MGTRRVQAQSAALALPRERNHALRPARDEWFATPGPVAAGSCLRAERWPDSTSGWEPIDQHGIDAETIVGERDPDHARAHPHKGAATRSCSARGEPTLAGGVSG